MLHSEPVLNQTQCPILCLLSKAMQRSTKNNTSSSLFHALSLSQVLTLLFLCYVADKQTNQTSPVTLTLCFYCNVI